MTPTVSCVLPAGQGTFTGPQDVTMALDKATVAPGGALTGTVTLGASPAVSNFSLSIWATPSITLNMRGAATGSVTITGPEQKIDVVAGQSPPIQPYQGAFNVPVGATAGGKVEFTVVKMVTDARLAPGSDPLPTVCTVTAGGDAAVADVSVEGSAGQPATVNAPDGDVRPGQPLTLTGSGFTPNAAAQAALCDADGGNCLTERFVSQALSVDGQGNLSGTAKLATAGLPDGAYVLRVTGGDKEGRDGLSVKAFVPTDPRAAQAVPNTGPLGTVTAVSGTNWTPNASVNLVQVDKDGLAGSGTITVATDYNGAFTTPYTVTDAATTQIRVREGISSSKRVFVPFTVATGPPPLPQPTTVTMAPGALTMTQAGGGISFGTVTLNGTVQQVKAPLNQITVVDARGGTLGWSLTGTMTDLVAANGVDKIPAGNISWVPACAAAPTSLSPVTTGSPGPLGTTAVTLCGQNPDTGKATGGRFTADAELTLSTPEFAAAGTYGGTLTITLV
ncbi:hypothetical protein [Yinghuangia seranimata]|uniref:hypothetical protein n=1 Tax=Yinghuangia seranimata TaxID=408067 RepID=UPI00248AD98A|nr:hypothetical protein [Yinghuangia seranimata]MDI2124898.1 hypothetical protein [Yinghuangia seranimata]